MTAAGHTPGPWTAKQTYVDGSFRISGPDRRSVVCCPATSNRPADEKRANAALIARAPDLLAENARLKRALDVIAGLGHTDAANHLQNASDRAWACSVAVAALAASEGRPA